MNTNDMRPTVLITGASSGIGRALARGFSRDGARLILVARRADRIAELATELERDGAAVMQIVEDLTSDGACGRIVERVEAAGAPIDILVNNAGIGDYGEFRNQDPGAAEGMMRLNMHVPVQLTRLLLPDMVARRRGHILNVASTAAFQPTPYMGVYGATKWFVLSHSLSMRYELEPFGIGVTCLCPGPVDTEFFDRDNFRPQRKAFLKTAMSADKVADAALRGIRRNRAVIVLGLINKIGVVGSRLAPLRTSTRVAARLLKPINPP